MSSSDKAGMGDLTDMSVGPTPSTTTRPAVSVSSVAVVGVLDTSRPTRTLPSPSTTVAWPNQGPLRHRDRGLREESPSTTGAWPGRSTTAHRSARHHRYQGGNWRTPSARTQLGRATPTAHRPTQSLKQKPKSGHHQDQKKNTFQHSEASKKMRRRTSDCGRRCSRVQLPTQHLDGG